MSKSRLKIAAQLFDVYAKNLSWYHPHLVDVVLCPLCLQPFTKDAIESKTLTLEHIIPSALGGKFVTLTCSDCNSKSGTKLDAHLIQRLRTSDAWAGKSKKPLRVRVKMGSGEFGADLYLSLDQNPNIQIIGIPDISNPTSQKRAFETFKAQPQEFSISGSLGYKDVQSRVAALRIAYLLSFSYFGYGYILYENLNQLREQIFQFNRETDVLKGVIWLDSTPMTNVLAFLKEPQELRCFLAIVELSTEQKRVLGVALPGPDRNSATIYQRWKEATATLKTTKPVVDIFAFSSSYVSDPEYKFLPARIWRGLATVGGEQSS